MEKYKQLNRSNASFLKICILNLRLERLRLTTFAVIFISPNVEIMSIMICEKLLLSNVNDFLFVYGFIGVFLTFNLLFL